MSCVWTTTPSNLSSTNLAGVQFSLTCSKFSSPDDSPKFRHAKKCNTRAFASRKSVKKFRRQRETQKDLTPQLTSSTLNENDEMVDRSPSGVDNVEDNNKESTSVDLDAHKSITIPSRTAVLQACTVTSGLIAVSGVLIRQVSHVASMEGWPILDCSTEVSFSFEMWHLRLVTGLVILISSCRYLLLKTWPDFAESSDAANQQVLTSLQPLDYLVVAFLPGFSEGNIRGVCLWLCNNFLLKSRCANGFSCSEQSSRRALMALHIKVAKINLVDHKMPDASMLLARHDPAANFSALVLGLPKQLVPKWGKTQFTCQELASHGVNLTNDGHP